MKTRRVIFVLSLIFLQSSAEKEADKNSNLRERVLQGKGGGGGNKGGDDSLPECVNGQLSKDCGANKKQAVCGTCAHPLICSIDSSKTCVEASTTSCAAIHCGNDVVNTFGPLNCNSNNLQLSLLDSFDYTDENGVTDVLIKLYGPLNPTDAAALIITAPHGGDLKPEYIPDRTTNDPNYCPTGCKISKDTNTLQIATKVAEKVISNYCKVPYLVVNELHRSKMDANRDVDEAAFGIQIAIDAWQKFHDFIQDAQLLVRDKFETVSNDAGVVGIPGLMFDVHGYAGTDWHPDGGLFTQWGYRLSKDTLNQSDHCPVDSDLTTTSTRGTFTHARQITGQSLECLVRGPKSLGTRFNNQLPVSGQVDLCGAGLPSFEYQDPGVISSDPNFCSDSDGVCHYYTGGFDLEVHERFNWENIVSGIGDGGVHMNTVQAELPKCIRFGGDAVHADVADKLSIALCSFMYDLFGPNLETC